MTKRNAEQYIAIVHAFDIGKQNTLYLTISKDARKILNVQKGDKFLLKIDSQGRLVYEPIRDAAETKSNQDKEVT